MYSACKRWLVIILSVMMIVTMMPGAAFADGDEGSGSDPNEDEVAQAKAAYEEAVGKAEEAAREYASKKTALEQAKADLKAAQEQLDNAGHDFINSKAGGTLTYESLSQAYRDNGTIGQSMLDDYDDVLKSAYSVENLNKAADFVTECNTLRASHNVSPLKINYRLMILSATSAAVCSDPYEVTPHLVLYELYSQVGAGNVMSPADKLPPYPSENLAWGFTDPFDGWYTEEKQTFEEYVASGDYPGLETMTAYEVSQTYPAISEQTGHYLNIIDSELSTTGYAVASEPVRVDEQSFGRTYYQNGYGDNVTPDEFKTALAAFVTEKQNAVQEATTIKGTAESDLATAETALQQAEAKRDEAYEAYQKALILYAEPIQLNDGKTKVIDSDGQVITYKYTAEKSGECIFKFKDDFNDGVHYSLADYGYHYTYGRVLTYNEDTDSFDVLCEDVYKGEYAWFVCPFEAEEGKDYYLQAQLTEPFVEEIPFRVLLLESPVQGISIKSYTPNKDYDFIENDPRYGNYETDSNGDQYFKYEIGPEVGDTLVLDTDEGEKEYVYEKVDSSRGRFVCGDETLYEDDDIRLRFIDDQSTQHWTPGNNNYVTVSYGSKTIDIPVTIRENNVRGISFTPANPYIIRKNDTAHGEWKSYIFYYKSEFYEGDKLSVTTKDGATIDYTYQYDHEGNCMSFICDNGDAIDPTDLIVTDDQKVNHWDIGQHTFVLTYQGISCDMPIAIYEVIDSIEYEPVSPYKLNEEDLNSGTYEFDDDGKEFFRYIYYANIGDKLVFNTEIGEIRFELKELLDSSGKTVKYYTNGIDKIPAESVSFSDDQRINHWYKETNNKFTVKYAGMACEVPVEIIEYTLSSMRYEPVDDIEFIKNDKRHGNYMRGYSSGSFFYYFRENYRVGDKLIITVDGNEIEYVCSCDNDSSSFVFTHGEDTIPASDITVSDNQYISPHWDIGLDNYIYYTYASKRCKVKVEIVESPIKSITYFPVTNYTFFEYDEHHGGWNSYGSYKYFSYNFGYDEGGRLLVNTGSEQKEYTYQYYEAGNEWCFVGSEDTIDTEDIFFTSEQYYENWTAGGDNRFTVSYLGREYDVPVTILSITSIQYVPVNTIVFKENDINVGFYYYSGQPGEFFYYSFPKFEEGAKLLLDTEIGTLQYVYGYDEETKKWCFIGDNETINDSYIKISDDQNNNHWYAGNDYSFTLTYANKTCQVPVSIIEHPVKGISYVPAKTYEYIENDLGAGQFATGSESGTEFFYYSRYSRYDEHVGDKIIVTTDNGQEEYVIKYNDKTQEYYVDCDLFKLSDVQYTDDQLKKHWTIGSDNYFTVSIAGRTCQVPVTIKETPVISISFTPVAPFEFFENTNGALIGSIFYYIISYREGDKLTVTTAEGNRDYYYQPSSYEHEEGFINGDDKLNYVPRIIENQQSVSWTIGSSNSFKVEYLGRTSQDIPVTIVNEEYLRQRVVEQAGELLDDVKDVSSDDYSEATYGTLTAAKEYLEQVLGDDSSDRWQIEDAIERLRQALVGLKTKAEEEAENRAKAVNGALDVISSTSGLLEEGYTYESYNNMIDAKNALSLLIADSTSLSSDINNASDALQEKIRLLIPISNVAHISEQPALCTQPGNIEHWVLDGKYYSDVRCNTELSEEEVVIKPLGHDLSEWIKVDDQEHKRNCSRDEYMEKAPHTWDDGVVTLQPTETEEGVRKFTCSACGAEKTETVPAKGHKHTLAHIVKLDATCEKSGNIEYWKCTGCSLLFKTADCNEVIKEKDTIIDPLGHAYGAWTAINENQHQRTCSRDTTHVEIEPHTWDEGIVTKKPTATEEGERTHTCSVCGAKSVDILPMIQPGDDPDNRTKQKGEDGTALGKGASAEAAEAAILGMKSDADPKGSRVYPLLLRSPKQTKSSIKLAWTRPSGAVKFVIYGNKCGKTNKMKKIKNLTKTSVTLKKAVKTIGKGKYYKFIIVSLDKNNNVVSTSKVLHIATKGGKAGNFKSVTTKAKKNKVSVKRYKSFKLAGKGVPVSKKLKVTTHCKIRYESANTKIASVNKYGVIKGKKKGTTYVYAYSQSGTYAKIKVTVK